MTVQPSRLLLLLFLFTACVFRADAETERRSFHEAYADPETGVSFPSIIGGYRKTEVVRNFNPLIGTVIRYADVDGGCADVYIYTLDSSGKKISDESFQSHFREICKAIEGLSKKNSHVNDIQTLGSENFRMPPRVFGKRAYFRMNIAGDLRNSELAVFPFFGRIVKIRISTSSYYSAGETNRSSKFLETIANLFNRAEKTKKVEKK